MLYILGIQFGGFLVLHFSFLSKLVKTVLEQKPGGEKIMRAYAMRGEMKDRTRRNLVNIVVADMVEKYG